MCKDQYANRLLQNLFQSLKIRKNSIDIEQKQFDYFDNFEKCFMLTVKDKLSELIRSNPGSYVISECLKSFDYKNCNSLHKVLEENLLRLINDNRSVNLIKTLISISQQNKIVRKMLSNCIKDNFNNICMNKAGHYILISYFEEIDQNELSSYSESILKGIDLFLYKSFSYKVVRKFTKLLENNQGFVNDCLNSIKTYDNLIHIKQAYKFFRLLINKLNPTERINQRKIFESHDFLKYYNKDCQILLLSVFDNFESIENEDDNDD